MFIVTLKALTSIAIPMEPKKWGFVFLVTVFVFLDLFKLAIFIDVCEHSFFMLIAYLPKYLKTHFRRSGTTFGNWKPFKNDEKCFLVHVKNSFRFQDVWFFFLLFGHAEKRFD